MALRYQADTPKQAQPGDMLIVVHEFIARSPDELSLSKGDRIELIERDDDFGDGWYLGRHTQNGNTGLFPEVYTTTTPRNLPNSVNKPKPPPAKPSTDPAMTTAPKFATRTGTGDRTPPAAPEGNASDYMSVNNNSNISSNNSAVSSSTAVSSETQQRSGNPPISPSAFTSADQGAGNPFLAKTPPQTSAVMNETLSVIDEHITNMNRPSHLEPMSSIAERRPSSQGSGSHYSASTSQTQLPLGSPSEHEEEQANFLSEKDVSQWSPNRVAEYLESLGVEKTHCDLFRNEEFTGEVLLQMDQSQMFMKELDLGPIGRRMRTWQKIKALQEEVRASAATSARSSQATVNQGQRGLAAYGSGASSPRPSAASIRSIGHRRHSSTDPVPGTGSRISDPRGNRGKQSSFDRGWTMNDASPTSAGGMSINSNTYNAPVRSASSNHAYTLSTDRSLYSKPSRGSSQVSLGAAPPPDVDKGYASGGEGDPKRNRNVLRKRDGQSRERPADHVRAPSYGSEKRRSSGFFWQKKTSESPIMPAAAENHDLSTVRHSDGVRIVSEPLQGNQTSPAVTRLEYDDASKFTPDESKRASTASEKTSSIRTRGFRTISDAITGREKSLVTNTDKLITTESSFTESPDRTSASPSGDTPTYDVDDANKSEFSTPAVGSLSSGTKRKPKQATSAYIRGLEKKTPQEQMVGCEYSGWMKKKSSNIMTTWKPRLFVLRGRRLSYYYSETDTEEKGLIDISNHRVLPADTDFITNVHAALTGATAASPAVDSTSPNASQTAPTVSMPSLSPTPTSPTSGNFPTKSGDGENEAFLFKLVPPRTGLSKGVNFTKPSVHYFAVPTRREGRLWMAALMKATIDRDDTMSVITTYQQKTISLEQARARNERPPFLKGVGEEEEDQATAHEATAPIPEIPIVPPKRASGVQEERGYGVYEPAVTTDEMVENMVNQVPADPSAPGPATTGVDPSQGNSSGLGIQGLSNGSAQN